MSDRPWPPEGAVHRVVTIVNQRGLHARAAAAFAKTAGRYKAAVLVRRGERWWGLRDICPHQGARLSAGTVTGKVPSCLPGDDITMVRFLEGKQGELWAR